MKAEKNKWGVGDPRNLETLEQTVEHTKGGMTSVVPSDERGRRRWWHSPVAELEEGNSKLVTRSHMGKAQRALLHGITGHQSNKWYFYEFTVTLWVYCK